MNYIKLISQLLIVCPIIYYSNLEISVLLLSITIDSIFSALVFIKLFILDDLSLEDLLTNLNKIYKIKPFNRYIYYLTLEFIYTYICYLLWCESFKYLYYFLVLITCPYILNKIYEKYLLEMVKYIDYEKNKFLRMILCKQFAIIINTFSNIYINKNPNISFTELLYIIDDYDNMVNNFTTFLKNFFIISVIHYTRKKSNIVYSKLITYFYTYKTGNVFESIDYSTAKKKFSDVIINKKWDKLLDDDILHSIIYIYSLQENSNFDIGVYIVKFNYMVIKMFTIWTIGSFFNNTIIIPFLSLFFTIYKKPFNTIFNLTHLYKYLFKISALILGLFVKDYFLISLICEFGYILIVNKIVGTIVQYMNEKFIKIYNVLTNYNKYNLFIIFIFSYIKLLKIISQYYDLNIIHYAINYSIFLIFINNNNWKYIIYNSIVLLGYLSKYQEIHLLFIITSLYIFLNLYHTHHNNKNISISILAEKMNSTTIEKYYDKLETINNINENISDNEYNTEEELVDSSLFPENIKIIDDDKEDGNVLIYNNPIIIENYIK